MSDTDFWRRDDRPFGRIRLRKHQAQVYHDLLLNARRTLVQARWYSRETGEPYAGLQQQINVIDEMFSELNRLMLDLGWDFDA